MPTRKKLMHSLDEIILTNLDVMVHAITWVITLIADNKHVQQELHEEVDANWHNLQEYLSRSDTHLHRAFLETIRLQPAASKDSPQYIHTPTSQHRNKSLSLTKVRAMRIVFNIGESSPSVKNIDGVLVKPGNHLLEIKLLLDNGPG
ncbi:cytochrome P450 [Colletotrichum tofieldiae]|nr:cytochrome P450 [Colletotrichum tofieldiae]